MTWGRIQVSVRHLFEITPASLHTAQYKVNAQSLFLFISLFLHGCIHKMLLHSYRFWQLLTLPICFGSLHRLLFVHLIVIPGEHSPAWFRLVHDAGKQVRYDRNQAAATFYVRCGSDLKLGYNWIKPLWPQGGITLLDIQSMCLCVEKCVECSCMFINHDESIPDVSSQTVSCTHTIVMVLTFELPFWILFNVSFFQ